MLNKKPTPKITTHAPSFCSFDSKLRPSITNQEPILFQISLPHGFPYHLHPLPGHHPVTLSYDAIGNTTSDGNYTLGYNLRGRLTTVGINGNLMTYSHDNA